MQKTIYKKQIMIYNNSVNKREVNKMKALFVGGALNGLEIEVSEAIKLWNVEGYTDDLSELREKGVRGVHRKELDNQPQFQGYLSPMWDGGKLRYETQEVYDLYFD